MSRPLLLLLLLFVLAPLAAAPVITVTGNLPPGARKRSWEIFTGKMEQLFFGDSLAPPADTFRIIVGQQKQPIAVRLPEWGAGGTIGPDSILVPLSRQRHLGAQFDQVVRHELVHAVIMRRCPSYDPPRWFHEGCARALSGELPAADHLIIARALLAGRLLSLDSIDNVNRFSSFDAALAYAQSHGTAQFLITEYGRESLPLLLAAACARRSMAGALYEELGLTTEEFESLARAFIRKRYGLWALAGDYLLLWMGLSFFVVVAYGVVRIQRARRAALMEQDEEESEGLSPPATPDS